MRKLKICGHWDGGSYIVSGKSKEHYQAIVGGDLVTVYGDHSVEDNFDTSDGIYGRGVRGFNTDLISIAAACMAGAREDAGYPNFDSEFPLKEEQFIALAQLAASYCVNYQIPVQRDRVFLHCEVEHTFGIKQDGKWDISVLPWDQSIRGHRAVGDYFRELVSQYVLTHGNDNTFLAQPDDLPTNRPTLRHGMRGTDVKILQTDLSDLRYHVGKKDGIFGDRVRGGVLAFQADNDLDTDGVVGPRTWAKLATAEPRKEREVTITDLAESGTLKDLQVNDRLADVTSLAAAGKLINDGAVQIQQLQAATDQALTLWDTVRPFWPLLLVLVAFLVWRGLNSQTRRRRLIDAITGAHDGR